MLSTIAKINEKRHVEKKFIYVYDGDGQAVKLAAGGWRLATGDR
jgi:hypothetical protein